MRTVLENEFVWIKPIGSEVMFCKYKKGVVINLEGAKKIVRERLDFQKGVDYFILVDAFYFYCIGFHDRFPQ